MVSENTGQTSNVIAQILQQPTNRQPDPNLPNDDILTSVPESSSIVEDQANDIMNDNSWQSDIIEGIMIQTAYLHPMHQEIMLSKLI